MPWIPAWTAADLIGHLGTVHRWATAILQAGHTERPSPDAATPPPAEGLLEWYAAGLTALVTTLRSTPPDAPAWHMSPAAEKVAAAWARRQAHELLVHRCDLEAAAGVAHATVDTALAEDGVDELLTVVVPRWAHTEPLSTAEASVAVTGSDTGRTWSVRVLRGVITVEPDLTGAEDAHLRAPVHALLLHLWGRPANVSLDGDPAAAALLRGR
ncbi:maleylpyruvate isomerase N-terminal domain-containing protein [Blastococcus brunescens]|uniref:Maleylpyruvate isomerase family mycothiol-dependent enzyme n=1 Tax=Blastococcus brunescens TaxID=1564165 RepID=A0ABZ1AXA9_9ACTN|nr:maleylpyruvate isomerase family mycothiol-dependent enzyme [Blastococcus sp. BMG 8361]WRL63204.1 maleylpyruvate isomerase family mycothiol-dependent enzyme [Blastococcus sp. BMG 8361]